MNQFNRDVVVKFPNDGLSVSGLRISFNVEKNKSTFNTATVEIYNLSKETAQKLSVSGGRITIEAGYLEAHSGMIFSGKVAYATTKVIGADVITTFQCDDGADIEKSFSMSKSFSESTSIKKILQAVVSESAAAVKAINLGSIADAILNKGFVVTDTFTKTMNDLTKKVSAEWSIQDGSIKIVKKGSADNTPIVDISVDNGLISSPEKIEIIDSETEKKSLGYKATCLLNPYIECFGRVNIRSRSENTASPFRVIQVNHAGDTHGAQWDTSFQCEEIVA